MTDRLDITDEYSVKCDFILNTVTFIDAALNIWFKNKNENVMFYYFIYLAKGFRMRPKVRSTLTPKHIATSVLRFKFLSFYLGIKYAFLCINIC